MSTEMRDDRWTNAGRTKADRNLIERAVEAERARIREWIQQQMNALPGEFLSNEQAARWNALDDVLEFLEPE
jgi:hypothetical protein